MGQKLSNKRYHKDKNDRAPVQQQIQLRCGHVRIECLGGIWNRWKEEPEHALETSQVEEYEKNIPPFCLRVYFLSTIM